jgi:hypothetical protein
MNNPDSPPQLDPEFLLEIEEALEPVKPLFAPEVIEIMRARLIASLTDHPVGQTLVRQGRNRVELQDSGAVPTPEGAESDAAAPAMPARRIGNKDR